MEECQKIAMDDGVDIINIIYGNDSDLINETQFSQPCIVAIEYCLASMWMEEGLMPQIVLGHSIGEYAASVVAEVMCLRDAIHLSIIRGRLMSNISSEKGVMVACRLSAQDAQTKINQSNMTNDISIAAMNAPNSIVISGKENLISKFLEYHELTGRSKQLSVSHAFHSQLMKPMISEFSKAVKSVNKSVPKLIFISTVTGKEVKNNITIDDYWLDQITGPVRFMDGIRHASKMIGENGVIFEIGPVDTLLKLTKQSLAGYGYKGKFMSSIEKSIIEDRKSSVKSILLYLSKTEIKHELYKRRSFMWETFPNKRQHPLILNRIDDVDEIIYTGRIREDVRNIFEDHKVMDHIVVPAAAFIDLFGCIDRDKDEYNLNKDNEYTMIEDLIVQSPMVLQSVDIVGEKNIKIYISKGDVELVSNDENSEEEISHCSGHVCSIEEIDIKKDMMTEMTNVIKMYIENIKNYTEINIECVYEKLKMAGLCYGPKFKLIENGWKIGDDEAIVRLKISENIDIEKLFKIHPSIIDCAMQSTGIAMQNDININMKPLIPFSFGSCIIGKIYNTCYVYAYANIIKKDMNSITANITIVDENYYLLCIIEKVMMRAVETVMPKKIKNLLWTVSWNNEIKLNIKEKNDKWLFICSDNIPNIFDNCIYLLKNQCNYDNIVNTLNKYQFKGIINAAGLDKEMESINVLNISLELTKAIITVYSESGMIPTWNLTCGTQPAPDIRGVEELPLHAGIFGFMRSARIEMGSQIQSSVKMGVIDLDADWLKNIESSLKKIMGLTVTDDEMQDYELAFRDEIILSRRLNRSEISTVNGGSVKLLMSERGTISKLEIVDLNDRLTPVGDQMEIRVRAVGLNFRDVLNVMGLYPGDPGEPGADASGVVVRIGDNSEFKIGEDVFGLAPGCLRSFVTTEGRVMERNPKNMSYEECATIPSIFATVEVAFADVAKVKDGDRVLIHAATGGVGLAAIQHCNRVGAIVYGTCGSEAKKKYLESIGVTSVSTSRDAKVFSQEMGQILENENAKIDVVLNCLIDDYIPESLKLMGKGGRFMELGKRGIWSYEKMSEERPDVTFYCVALDTLASEDMGWFKKMLSRLKERAEREEIKVNGEIPLSLFNLQDDMEEGVLNGGVHGALRHLQRAQHIGKVIVRIPPKICEDSSTYVITGGMGGLGLTVAEWMANEGAKRLLLVSRSGTAQTEQLKSILERLEKRGCVLRVKCDCANTDDVDDLLKDENIKGVIHAAGVLDDGLLNMMTKDSIEVVWNAKALSAINLHKATKNKKKIDFFIMFSSMASLLGNFAQANYCAANSFLDSLSSYRRNMGLAGLSIQWGPWVEQGMAVNMKDVLSKAGMVGLNNDLGLSILSSCMMNDIPHGVIGALSVNWRMWIDVHGGKMTPFFSNIKNQLSPPRNRDRKSRKKKTKIAINDISKDELVNILAKEVQLVSGLTEMPDRDLPLMDLGVDSLGAVEFRNSIADSTGVKLSQDLLFNSPTLEIIAIFIKEHYKESEDIRPQGGREILYNEEGVTDSQPVDVSDHRLDRHDHPISDVDNLINNLNVDCSNIIPLVDLDNIKSVLITGATGFVGRFQVAYLLEQKPDLNVICLVRCTDPESGAIRIQKAIRECGVWSENYASRIRALSGDLSKERFGLSEEIYNSLLEEVDMIMHTAADVNTLKAYKRLRDVNVMSVVRMIQFASSYKHKYLHFASTIGQFPAFVAFFARNFSTCKLMEDEAPDVMELDKYFPPHRQGYMWSKWAAEKILNKARSCGVSVTIHRIPNTFCAWCSGFTDADDNGTALAAAAAQLAAWPTDFAGVCTPVDVVALNMVRLAFARNRRHHTYHLVNPTVVHSAEQQRVASDLGLDYQLMPADEFLNLVREKGDASPLFKFLPVINIWKYYWFHHDSPREKWLTFPISTSNLDVDLPVINSRWPTVSETLRRSALFCIREGIIDLSSNGHSPWIHHSIDEQIKSAIKFSKLSVKCEIDILKEPMKIIFNKNMEISSSGGLARMRIVHHAIGSLMKNNNNSYICDKNIIIVTGLPGSNANKLLMALCNKIINKQGPRWNVITWEHIMTLINTDSINIPLEMMTFLLSGGVHNINQINLSDLKYNGYGIGYESSMKLSHPCSDTILFIHALRAFILVGLLPESATGDMSPSKAMMEMLTANSFSGLQEAYNVHWRFLQTFKCQFTDAPWIIGGPEHSACLNQCIQTYPNATIVHVRSNDHQEAANAWLDEVTPWTKQLSSPHHGEAHCAVKRSRLMELNKMIHDQLSNNIGSVNNVITVTDDEVSTNVDEVCERMFSIIKY
eukprot:GHVL01000063.1.p1 GENE.GHVL01000063.1~~GHVL01000063.1.p1  ORF type:complete len:2609 (+),score=591.47 GHVL01000063.1:913-7827(+)